MYKNGKGFKEKTMIEKLPDGHIIKTMVKEHDHILALLDELTDIAHRLSNSVRDIGETLLLRANQLAVKIIGAEPHHQREELILFPALEENGITSPTQCMRMEHAEIREMKHALKQKTENSGGVWSERVMDISKLIDALCLTLRQHIQKENTILYPMALTNITDKSKWIEMRIQCDKIGYCCFCPSDNQIIHPEKKDK
jgi:hypothetical protein|tara:strand:+ start:333 stop:926 length:594 start_codon:yes stop_codon:yes gene_type:complete